MKDTSGFSFRSRLKSFRYAFNGMRLLILQEHNARIHFVAAIIAILMGYILNLTSAEWCLLTLVIAGVFIAELINTAIENLCNVVQPDYHEKIKVVKDVSAAAVLLAALSAVIVAMILFIPKIICLF
ncbi:MAG: diacylglycerol kinase family protein [Bacteroidota bacterium]